MYLKVVFVKLVLGKTSQNGFVVNETKIKTRI